MRFFKPGVQRVINLVVAAAAVCALVLPVTWAYRQGQEARLWRETACAYRLREAARPTNFALAVRYGDDPCATRGRQGQGLAP
jgi:hypothetical protein